MNGGAGRVLVIGAGLAGAAVAWAATRVAYAVTVVSTERPAGESDVSAPGVVFGVGPPGSMFDWMEMSARTMAAHARLRDVGRSALEEALFAAERGSGFQFVEHRIAWHDETLPEMSAAEVDRLAERLVGAGYEPRREGGSLVGDDAILSSRRLTLELLRQARARAADLRFGSEVLGSRTVSPEEVAADIDGEEERFERVYWAGLLPASGSAADPRVVLHQRNGEGEKSLPWIAQTADAEIALFPASTDGDATTLRRVGRNAGDGRFVWRELPSAWRPFVGPPRQQLLSESYERPVDALPETEDRVACVAGLASWPVASVLGASVEMVGAGPRRKISG